MGRRPESDLDPDVTAMIDGYCPVEQLSPALAQSDLLVVCTTLKTRPHAGLIDAADIGTAAPQRAPLQDRMA